MGQHCSANVGETVKEERADGTVVHRAEGRAESSLRLLELTGDKDAANRRIARALERCADSPSSCSTAAICPILSAPRTIWWALTTVAPATSQPCICFSWACAALSLWGKPMLPARSTRAHRRISRSAFAQGHYARDPAMVVRGQPARRGLCAPADGVLQTRESIVCANTILPPRV